MVVQACTGTRGNHSQPPPAGMDLSQFVDAGEDLASLAPPPVSTPIPPSSQNILVERFDHRSTTHPLSRMLFRASGVCRLQFRNPMSL